MLLSPRQEVVLARLVEAYTATARPVSSAQVRRQRPGLTLSTATIRSCLGALGELGLVRQPHPSGGRLPTALGLSTYLAGLRPRLRGDDRRRLESAARAQAGDLPAQVAELSATLAALSGLLAVVAVPSLMGQHLVEVVLVSLGPSRLIALWMAPSGLAHQATVALAPPMAPEVVAAVERLLNARLGGLAFDRLRQRVAEADWAGAADGPTARHAIALAPRILPSRRQWVLAHGAAALSTQPEFRRAEALGELVAAAADEAALRALEARLMDDGGVQVVLEPAAGPGPFGQLSGVGRALGAQADGGRTSVGLWGPQRMDFGRLMPLVAHATELLDRLAHER